MKQAVIVSAVRTPVGRYLGALKTVQAYELAALVLAAPHSARRSCLKYQTYTLTLQLHFSFEMCGACFGLMGAPPQ